MTNQVYYAVPDLHGRYDLLKVMLADLYQRHPDGGKIIFLGDYIDRGPDAYMVITTLMTPPKNWQFICLMGNHEQMFLQSLSDRSEFYDVNALFQLVPNAPRIVHFACEQFDPEIRLWMENLKLFHFEDNNIFAHAWYQIFVTPERQLSRSVLWHRVGADEPFGADTGKFLIHGHTPVYNGPVEAKGRVNLDCGAVFYDRLVIAQMKQAVTGPVGYLEYDADGPKNNSSLTRFL